MRSFTILGKLSKILSLGLSKISRAKKSKILFGLFFILFLVFFNGKIEKSLILRSSQRGDTSFFTGHLFDSLPGKTKSEPPNAYLSPTGSSQSMVSESLLIQGNQFLSVAPPFMVESQSLASLNLSEEEEEGRKEIIEYAVKEGDTLSGIATSFDISLQTLLWANELNKKSFVQPGQKLVILPVTGVYHMVKSGDTLSQITEDYGGDLETVIGFNELSDGDDISLGDLLIIPGGEPPLKPAPVAKHIPLASSYFLYPVSSPYLITQGLHWYNAIDFAHAGNACGKPVFAAAGGEVLKIKYGYNKGAGNYIHILHPNGVVTHYGHLQSILVSPGQRVSQGGMIGLIGHTGYTIPAGIQGCHLHFEVRGARNPFSY